MKRYILFASILIGFGLWATPARAQFGYTTVLNYGTGPDLTGYQRVGFCLFAVGHQKVCLKPQE